MSHSSGIPVSASLRAAFSPEKRILKVEIVNDELVEVEHRPISGTWEKDFEQIPSLLAVDKPCYLLYNRDPEAKQWLLFCYVPDKSKVKDKMLYASTRANLKLQLGNSYFVEDIFGTVPVDFSLKGFQHHVESRKSEAPLTESEMTKKTELHQPIYSGGSTNYVHGVSFPVDEAVFGAVKEILSRTINYIQLAVDITGEKIILGQKATIDFAGFIGKIPTSEPRFHVFAWKHDVEGSETVSTLYVFSCPDGSKGTTSAPVKMRMLYSSSKANVSSIITNAGGTIDLRLEINAGSDLIEEEIFAQLHPQAAEKEQSFSRPSRPGKGGRKLIRGEKK